MIRQVLWLLLIAPAGALAQESGRLTAAQAQEVSKQYEAALNYFTAGQYSRGIKEWNAILSKDPTQKTAQKMIVRARGAIDERDKDKQAVFFDFVAKGQFQEALVALQVLLERDPLHDLYQRLERRVEEVVDVIPRSPKNKRAWRPAVIGMTGYLAKEDDLQLAYNGLRYALDLDRKEKRFKSLMELVLIEEPSLINDEVPTGMNLLEYKQMVGLNHIYDGKYHLAVRILKEVLQLEPNDLTALKRIGSAYFALKSYDEARQAWEQALQRSPTDRQLRKFLKRIEKK